MTDRTSTAAGALQSRIPPLFRMAVLKGTPEVVEAHLARGVSPDSRDAQGVTALMLAAARGRADICAVLLHGGADPSACDGSGRTVLAYAEELGDPETIRLLRPVKANPVSAPDSEPEVGGTDWIECWEAEDDAVRPDGDADVLRRTAVLQEQVASHVATDDSVDWADVFIELPQSQRRSRRRRSGSVRFRHHVGGHARSRPRTADVDDAIVALDLSRDADTVLAEASLAQVVYGSDASIELRRCVRGSPLFHTPVIDFLADDEGEARYVGAGVALEDYLELCDLMNAFTVLVHRQARGRRPAIEDRQVRSRSPLDPAPVTRSARDPEEILRTTPLSQAVLNGGPGPGLRRALVRCSHFTTPVADYLADDEAERRLRDEGGLTFAEFVELSDLVNAFVDQVLHRPSAS